MLGNKAATRTRSERSETYVFISDGISKQYSMVRIASHTQGRAPASLSYRILSKHGFVHLFFFFLEALVLHVLIWCAYTLRLTSTGGLTSICSIFPGIWLDELFMLVRYMPCHVLPFQSFSSTLSSPYASKISRDSLYSFPWASFILSIFSNRVSS